jgi:hypothetical protein
MRQFLQGIIGITVVAICVGCGGVIVPLADLKPTEERESYYYYNIRKGEQPQYTADISADLLENAGVVIGALGFAAEPIYLNFNGKGQRYYSFRTAYGQELFAVVLPAGRYVLDTYEQRDPADLSATKQVDFAFAPVRKFTVLPNTIVNIGYIYDASEMERPTESTIFRDLIQARKKGENELLLRRDLVSDDSNEAELRSQGRTASAIYKLTIEGLAGIKYYVAKWKPYTPPADAGMGAGLGDGMGADSMMPDTGLDEPPMDDPGFGEEPPIGDEGFDDALGGEAGLDDDFALDDEGEFGDDMGGDDFGFDDEGGEDDFGDFGDDDDDDDFGFDEGFDE